MKIESLNRRKVKKLFPKRDRNAHKGDFGRVLLLCGSEGYTGAAAFAAMGALRIGAGLVYLGVPESIYQIEAVKLTEAIVFPLGDKEGCLASSAISRIAEILPQMDAVLIGPGLGKNDVTLAVLTYVLQSYSGTVVVDADGINLLAAHKDLMCGREGTTILTPHEGEFNRLSDTLSIGREEAAVNFAREYGVIVVLKGNKTVITDGTCTYINRTGNPGMAVGGSGDVLAGIIVGMVGQGIDPLLSSAAGVWIHGAAGDLCARKYGEYSMLPSDMLSALPQLLK